MKLDFGFFLFLLDFTKKEVKESRSVCGINNIGVIVFVHFATTHTHTHKITIEKKKKKKKATKLTSVRKKAKKKF